jgi:hypothetical protein
MTIGKTTHGEEEKCREAWKKHQNGAHEDDLIPYTEFRSEYGLPDIEEEEDAWDDDGSDDWDNNDNNNYYE